MKVRSVPVFISTVLFTLSLLYLVPSSWRCAITGHGKQTNGNLDAGWQAAEQLYAQLGIAALTIIAIGLLVAWTGFIRKVRWAWFVVFIIVWGWAFPMLVLPLFQHTIALTFEEWMYAAWYGSGSPRLWAENVIVFLMMLVSLFLPVRAFFTRSQRASSAV